MGNYPAGLGLVEHGVKEGIKQIHQGLTAYRGMGAEIERPYFLALLAEAYEGMEQIEEGLNALAEAIAAANKTEERWYEAELYRLKGQLRLQSKVQDPKSKVEEAEARFLKAIEIARRQRAKSLGATGGDEFESVVEAAGQEERSSRYIG